MGILSNSINFKTLLKNKIHKIKPEGCLATKNISDSSKNDDRRYETMLVLRPDIFDEEKDRQLAKFEAFLIKSGAGNIECLIKGKQKMSYPIQGHWDGIFVLFQFFAKGKIPTSVHKMLSNPDVESQGNIVRWILLRLQ